MGEKVLAKIIESEEEIASNFSQLFNSVEALNNKLGPQGLIQLDAM